MNVLSALSTLPEPFKSALISEYEETQRAALRGDWEKVGLKAGKICEIAYCILEGVCTGQYPTSISKPRDMQTACRLLESQTSQTSSRSARIQIPRVIAATYELRNNRAIGHAGGDVSPNQMDGLFFNQAVKWIFCEIVRIFSELSLEDTTKIVDGISIRWSAAIWEDGENKRILIEGLGLKEKVIGLTYFSDFSCEIEKLRSWLSITNVTNFRNRVLSPLNDENMIHFDRNRNVVKLLPKGILHFENKHLRI